MIVLAKYSNYSKVSLIKNMIKLSKYIWLNNHIIKPKKKQPSFYLIYSLRQMELEMLKTVIKINLITNFIWCSNLFSRIFNFLIKS